MKEGEKNNSCPACGFYSIEKLVPKSNLLSTIYEKKCNNCNITLKKTKKIKIKNISLLFIASLIIILTLFIIKTNKKETKQKEVILAPKQNISPKTQDKIKPKESNQKIAKTIKKENKRGYKNNRFTSHSNEWSPSFRSKLDSNIRRFGYKKISSGPLHKAGLEVGDIITKANDLPANNTILMKLRDEVIYGQQKYSIIEVKIKKTKKN